MGVACLAQIIWTNNCLSLIGPPEINLHEIFIEENVFEKWHQFFFASIGSGQYA